MLYLIRSLKFELYLISIIIFSYNKINAFSNFTLFSPARISPAVGALVLKAHSRVMKLVQYIRIYTCSKQYCRSSTRRVSLTFLWLFGWARLVTIAKFFHFAQIILSEPLVFFHNFRIPKSTRETSTTMKFTGSLQICNSKDIPDC